MAKAFKFYLAYVPGNCRVWEHLNHKFVLISADLFSQVPDYLKSGNLSFIVDSGGFRIFSKGVKLDPREILEREKELIAELGGPERAVPVVLDYPLDPFKASKEEFEKANEKTLRNVELWAREFGNEFFPVVHAGRHLDLAELWAKRYLSMGFNKIAVGSSGPLSARDPCTLLRISKIVKEAGFEWVHVFGTGNSTAASLFLSGFADSTDSTSYVKDGKYGLARDPETLKLLKIRKGEKLRMHTCGCPVCLRGEPLCSGGRECLNKLEIHNAFWLLKAVSDEEVAWKLIKNRKQLSRCLRELMLES